MFGRKAMAEKYLMTETLIVEKLAYILASLCEGEKLLYLFLVLRKISHNLKKNMENFKIVFHPFSCPENQSKKSITKPWTAYLFSVLRYRSSSIKELRKKVEEGVIPNGHT